MTDKKLELTRTGKNTLYNYHPGSGKAFLSSGTGNEIISFHMMFFHRNGRYVLSFGNSKAIVLTPEQVKKIGAFAVADEEEH